MKNPERYTPLHLLTEEARKEIYEYAMQCSDEIIHGVNTPAGKFLGEIKTMSKEIKLTEEEKIQATELSTLIGTILGAFLGIGVPLRVINKVLEYWKTGGKAWTQLQGIPEQLEAARKKKN